MAMAPPFAKRARSTRGAAADFEHGLATIAVEVDEPQQVVQLLEMILIEIVEESARPDRMRGDLEIVDMLFPVRANFVDGRHAGYYSVSVRVPLNASTPASRSRRLTTRTFDLLVIGGGIYGLTIAADAAQRGLSVALIERQRLRQRHVVQSPAHHPRRPPVSADAGPRARARIGARASHHRASGTVGRAPASVRAASVPVPDQGRGGHARGVPAGPRRGFRSQRRRSGRPIACLPDR